MNKVIEGIIITAVALIMAALVFMTGKLEGSIQTRKEMTEHADHLNLCVPTLEKCVALARHCNDQFPDVIAQPRPVDGGLSHEARTWAERWRKDINEKGYEASLKEEQDEPTP